MAKSKEDEQKHKSAGPYKPSQDGMDRKSDVDSPNRPAT